MKPKYTDNSRYPNGYTTAAKTDIRKTFNRIRAEAERKRLEELRIAEERAEAERKTNVQPMKKTGTK